MTVFIFLAGVLVTALVVGAIALLVWGAVLDGRANEAEQRREAERLRGAGGARARHRPAV